MSRTSPPSVSGSVDTHKTSGNKSKRKREALVIQLKDLYASIQKWWRDELAFQEMWNREAKDLFPSGFRKDWLFEIQNDGTTPFDADFRAFESDVLSVLMTLARKSVFCALTCLFVTWIVFLRIFFAMFAPFGCVSQSL